MSFWRGRRVLITGHTGFKGAWLSHWLLAKGAHVFGLALASDTDPSLFGQLDLARRMESCLGDVRDAETVQRRVDEAAPEVVFHLAAQSLVRRSYRDPVATFSTNVMGTVHVLQAVRAATSQLALVAITTDKVYENHETVHAYLETDALGGHDPYSASKAACELAIASWRKSFLASGHVGVAAARAGNVIGGGDWAEDRLLPDFIRAAQASRTLDVRNPNSLRPWQHVLDPLAGYMTLAERLYAGDLAAQDAFNFGPDADDQRLVGDVLSEAVRHWPVPLHLAPKTDAPHEAGLLALNTDKARAALGWTGRWRFDTAVARTVNWYLAVHEGQDARRITDGDLEAFEGARA